MSGIEVISQFFENIRPRYSWSSSSSASDRVATNSADLIEPARSRSDGSPVDSSRPSSSSSIPVANDDHGGASNQSSTSQHPNDNSEPQFFAVEGGSLRLEPADGALERGGDESVDAEVAPLVSEQGSITPADLVSRANSPSLQPLSHREAHGPAITLHDGAQHQLVGTVSPTNVIPSVSGRSQHRMFNTLLPEDDGNSTLRRRVMEIQRLKVSERERAERMHLLMTEKYHSYQQSVGGAPSTHVSQSIPEGESSLSANKIAAKDAAPSYFNQNEGILGCAHYRRGVKLQCSACQKWHPCRFCHDEKEDHVLVRKDTKNMMCMYCGKAQPAQQSCKHCGKWVSCYYCDKCKLWDDDPVKTIYHCNDCGICRIGRGLGKDFFHCKKCGVCMSIELEGQHRCIERSTDCDCPICGEYMFTSVMTVVFMTCGHSIHHQCYYEHMKNSYRCPTCSRSVLNMETQFRFLDHEISCQPLPEPYKYWHCHIICNDCSAKSDVPFHFLGLKCDTCRSYNTREVKLIRPEDESGQATQNPLHHLMPDPETAGTIMHNRTGRQESVVTDLASVIREIDLDPRSSNGILNASVDDREATNVSLDEDREENTVLSSLVRSSPVVTSVQNIREGSPQQGEDSSYTLYEQELDPSLRSYSPCPNFENGSGSDCNSADESDNGTDDETSSCASFEVIRLPFHP